MPASPEDFWRHFSSVQYVKNLVARPDFEVNNPNFLNLHLELNRLHHIPFGKMFCKIAVIQFGKVKIKGFTFISGPAYSMHGMKALRRYPTEILEYFFTLKMLCRLREQATVAKAQAPFVCAGSCRNEHAFQLWLCQKLKRICSSTQKHLKFLCTSRHARAWLGGVVAVNEPKTAFFGE